MINWMQKNNKWLIVTLWISVVAFVGGIAFEGMMAFIRGNSSNTVATVGQRTISIEEYQQAYSQLYHQYQRILGDQFNQEMARQFRLSEAASSRVIQNNLILSYADELGLDVTEHEVIQELIKEPSFQKDGQFHKETYLNILEQNRINTENYESSIQDNLILRRITDLFTIEPLDQEIKTFQKLLFIEDDVNVKVLDQKNITLNYKDTDLKQFWEENTNRYLSDTSYELNIKTIPTVTREPSQEEIENYFKSHKEDFKDSTGKIQPMDTVKQAIINAIQLRESKKIALRSYLKLKKGQENFDKSVTRFEKELPFLSDTIQEIRVAKKGTLLKPFISKNQEYVIVKVVNQFNPQPLSYEKAQSQVIKDFEKNQKDRLLNEQADKLLPSFKGDAIGYVSKNSTAKIKGLTPQESKEFLELLFKQTTHKGQLPINDKRVLYHIKESRLGSDQAKNLNEASQQLSRIQNNHIMTKLIERLRERYPVKENINLRQGNDH